MKPLPDEIVAADALYHRILSEIHFSKHLNPENEVEARKAFLDGAEAPPFTYAAASWADEVLAAVAHVSLPESHPFGEILLRAFEGLVLLVEALKWRGAEHFDALARAAEWYPVAADLVDVPDPDVLPEPAQISAAEMTVHLRGALDAFGLGQWTLVSDPVMASRLMVESSKKLLHVNPRSWFRRSDLQGMVAHEIGVHVLRSAMGERQALKLFSTGLPGAGTTEEGLAIRAEERVGTLAAGFCRRQLSLLKAVERGRNAGFREVYQALLEEAGPGTAWAVSVRVKRGLKAPGEAGVYAKDTVYLRGYREVGTWIAEGGDLSWLYVGKVGTRHPIGEWMEEGLVVGAEAPGFWRTGRV